MYFIECFESIKRAKGVKKQVLKDQISYEHYKDALFSEKYFKHKMSRLQSFSHEIFALEEKKISISPFDDKRYILNDKIHTLAHGHHKIKCLKQ